MQAVLGQEARERRSSAAASKQVEAPAICMYATAPTEEVSLEDFESFALDRLAGEHLLHKTSERGARATCCALGTVRCVLNCL